MMKQKQPQRPLSTLSLVFFAISARAAVAFVFAVLVAQAFRPAVLEAQTSQTRAYVQALASERFEGRLAGSTGERLAGEYLAGELQKIGAKPLPGLRDYRLPFDFTAGARDAGSRLSVRLKADTPAPGAPPAAPGTHVASGATVASGFSRTGTNVASGFSQTSETSTDVRALSFSDNGDADGPVVFAGYGIVVPDSQDFGYNSYATLDVKDKIVLVLRYFPEDADQKTRSILTRYADLRYKAMAARQRGAKAMLVVAGPRSPNAGELVPMTFDTALAGSGIVAVSIRGQDAALMFARADKTLEEAQKALDSGNPHVTGFALPGVSVAVHAAVEREKRTGHNVVAYLPATAGCGVRLQADQVRPEPAATAGCNKPWVAIGAHYDHLGHGEAGNTLAGKDEVGKIHFGADDNASGSAAVLALASTLAKQPRRRHVLVALWSGEEIGLIGSSAFAAAPPLPLDTLAAYLNFDMVGRMQDNKLTVQATGTSAAWGTIIEQANVAGGFDLQLQEDPYQPTDVATFNSASVPCLSFFTGTHADYHRPSDTADKIDYEDLDRVVDFAAAIVKRIEDAGDAPQFAKVEQKTQPGGGRAGVRVFTGTIPDYSTGVKGLLLSGVIGGGPADQAGLQKGDVIVEIAGQTIANIYDYTYALDVLKIGQPTKVVYTRGGQQHETMLTPAARK